MSHLIRLDDRPAAMAWLSDRYSWPGFTGPDFKQRAGSRSFAPPSMGSRLPVRKTKGSQSIGTSMTTTWTEWTRPLSALTEAVWTTPVRSLVDLQERALIARRWFTMRLNDSDPTWEHPDDVDDWGDRTIAHLIHAVLNFGGQLASQPTPSREHLDYRSVAAEAEACSGADEDELTRLMGRESAFAQRIWDRPVENWFDVFLPLSERGLYFKHGAPRAEAVQTAPIMRRRPSGVAAMLGWIARPHPRTSSQAGFDDADLRMRVRDNVHDERQADHEQHQPER
jgi:hypothetical protein